MTPIVRLAVVVLILELCGALSLIAGVLSYNQAKIDSAEIVSLNTALNRADAAQKATAAVTRAFIAEIDFICTVETEDAKRLGLPPPSLGVCSLGMP